jgi:spore germination cell wall hydrolase CwlJ-like protein
MKRKILSLAVGATLSTAIMTNLLFSCNLEAMDKTYVVSEISNRCLKADLNLTPLSTYVPSVSIAEKSIAGIENNYCTTMAVKESDKAKKKEEKKKEDEPETIYDVYSTKEIEILQTIVEAEATGATIEGKINVANVILNRVESNEFPDTIEEVVFQKTQFSPIMDGRFYKVKITKDTIKACEKAFMEKDTTDGSLYFDCASNSWASRNKTFVMNDDYHNFYK